MNNRVDQIVGRKLPTPDAVFFIDLNGLKRVNDENTDNYFITKNSPIVSL